jgi:hypothetical protein
MKKASIILKVTTGSISVAHFTSKPPSNHLMAMLFRSDRTSCSARGDRQKYVKLCSGEKNLLDTDEEVASNA